MVFFRLVFGLLLLACVGCFVLSIATGEREWRRRGMRILKWTLLVAFGFFAVLIVQRLFDL